MGWHQAGRTENAEAPSVQDAKGKARCTNVPKAIAAKPSPKARFRAASPTDGTSREVTLGGSPQSEKKRTTDSRKWVKFL